ncbi:MAG: ABC transporter permease [Firmicutes bacterium]|nr:ABC transporter permease [Bacillota bacterium]
MAKYIVSRIGQTVIVIILVTLLTFVLINIAPGDPAQVMLAKRADEATIARVRAELGLDQPYHVQYLRFLNGLLHGDFGNSYFQKEPVLRIVVRAMKITLRLGALALLLSVGIGLLNGTLAAVFRGKWVDRFLMFLAMIGVSAPVFWLAVILQLFLGLHFKLLPISGQEAPGWMIMPVICLGVSHGASSARLVRTNMIEALNQDYVRTARSKGLSEVVVVGKHVLKNAGISIVTLVGMQLRSMISGAMVVETVFGLRGLGSVSYNAVTARDIPLIQGCVLYTAIVYVIINLVIDLIYGVLDPRVRLA